MIKQILQVNVLKSKNNNNDNNDNEKLKKKVMKRKIIKTWSTRNASNITSADPIVLVPLNNWSWIALITYGRSNSDEPANTPSISVTSCELRAFDSNSLR